MRKEGRHYSYGLCQFNDGVIMDVKASYLALLIDSEAGDIEERITEGVVGDILQLDYFWLAESCRRAML